LKRPGQVRSINRRRHASVGHQRGQARHRVHARRCARKHRDPTERGLHLRKNRGRRLACRGRRPSHGTADWPCFLRPRPRLLRLRAAISDFGRVTEATGCPGAAPGPIAIARTNCQGAKPPVTNDGALRARCFAHRLSPTNPVRLPHVRPAAHNRAAVTGDLRFVDAAIVERLRKRQVVGNRDADGRFP